MILGSNRTPYSTPSAAIPGFTPKLPNTGYYSHFHPFTQVTHAMVSASGMYRPPLQSQMGPHGLPDVPMPAPAVAPALPKPGGVAGFGFGSTGGVGGHTHVSAYRTMRMGMIPGVMASGANIRAGVTNAGARVQRMFPFQTAPLPPPPPPPVVVAPAPAATHGFGRTWRMAPMVVHGRAPQQHRRRRGWISRMWQPETVAEVAVQTPTCEWVHDSVSGISKQICNGRVTAYKDAQGNILRPGDYA